MSERFLGHDPALGGNSCDANTGDDDHLGESIVWGRNEGGAVVYNAFGLAVAFNGTVIACCEGRLGWQDYSPQHIFMKRSRDGGRSWSRNRIILRSRNGEVYHNPTLVADQITGRLFLFYGDCIENERSRVCYLSSEDHGEHWSRPVDVTDAFSSDHKQREYHLPACGHGIQTRDGRLIVPVWHRHGIDKQFRPDPSGRAYGTSMLMSDDGGSNWINNGWIDDATEGRLVELGGGKLLYNARNDSPRRRGNASGRTVAVSHDDGESWKIKYSFPLEYTFPTDSPSIAISRNLAVFARVDCPIGERHGPGHARRNLTIYLSDDGFRSFRAKRVIDPGNAYYADLCLLPDNKILLLYGCGFFNNWFGLRVRCLRFDQAWVEGDVSQNARGQGGN